MKHLAVLIYPMTVLVAACGAAPGTRPHDASAAQHEAAAQSEESQAGAHQAQHDPESTRDKEVCTTGKGRICWTAKVNPTVEHEEEAAEHRELAAQHRAASKALKDAEERACVGIEEEDRDVSPFAHTADITGVSELKAEFSAQNSKAPTQRTVGATVTINAVPGLTQEWLQRVVDCHLARNAAVGHDMPEMPYCPLVPKDVKATVRSVGTGFAVDMRADSSDSALEIWRRAQLLTAAR